MKYHLLAGAAAAALLIGGSAAVSAADLPAPAVPMIAAAPAVYDWTGFYAGVHIGYGWGDFDRRGRGGDLGVDGVLGGAQIGGNWQFDSFVLGVETDISGTGIDANRRGVNTDVNFFGTVRGRAGFAWDRFLIYGTGGFAYADVDGRVFGRNRNDWQWGWTGGGGVEFAVTDNLSMKVEYLYADLGEADFGRRGPRRFRFDYDQSLVRVGLNYKF